MKRFPVPKGDRPTCFGFGFGEDRICAACAYRESCRPLTVEWASHKSLMEQLVEAEEAVVSVLKSPSVEALYARLYEKHYGRAPTRKSMATTRSRNAFEHVRKLVESEGVDPALYVTANMHGMAAWLEEQKRIGRANVSFQPNMLSGENAYRRYVVYCRRARKQAYGADVEAMDGLTYLGDLINEIAADEERIGHYYVVSWISDDRITWVEAAMEAEPEAAWMSTDPTFMRSGYAYPKKYADSLSWRFGMDGVRQIKKVARLRAAVAVANLMTPGLADQLGCHTRFRWRAFAELMAMLFPKVEREELSELLKQIGCFWGI